MRFNSSPESANPKSESASALDSAEKKSQLKFTLQGQDILSSPRQYSADIQRVFPSLESRKTDPRLSLPSELLLLYGDPALLNARPNQAGDDKTGKSVKSSDISCLPGSSSSSTAEPSRAAYNANDSTSSARAGGARGAADAIDPLSPWLNPAAVPLSPNLNDVPPSRNLSDVPLSPNLSDVPPSRNLSDVPLSPNPSDVSPSPNSNEAPPNPYFRFGPVAADGPRDASPVRFDDAGYSTDIYYPDAKIRHIERDPQTHEVNAIVTSNAEGTSRLVKQNGSWFLDVQGMQLAFPGKVEVAKDGTVSMQTSEKGVWRIEQPDGTIREEKENADGARVGYDSNHQINKITRADGSSFQLVNGNTMLEAHPAGKTVTWTNNDGMWTSSDDGGKPRKNMLLHDNASLTFDDTAGLKHTINGRGFETLEGAGFGTIVSDAAGRPTEVDNADAKKARKYDYFDDKSYDIKSVNIIDKQTNKEVVYTRESKSSNQWRTSDGQVWSGEIKVSPDGVHSIKAANQYSNDNSSSKWTSYYPDGRQTSDSIGADGSRASYDSQNNLVSFRGADGQRIDRLKVNGKDTLTVYDPKLGETVNWSKENNGVWASDSPRFKDGRADLNFNTNGELSFTNDKGAKVQEHRDGSKQVSTKDGTRLDYDKDNQIVKAVRGNLERTFTRDASGIAVVKDRNLTTKEERTIFERRPPGEENRSNIFISANGDLSYQNPDGTASIERSSMIHVDLDRDGDITRVVSPQGTRTYEYLGEGSQKTVASVKDLRMTDKGAKSETWTRVANPDGSLSNEFRSLDD